MEVKLNCPSGCETIHHKLSCGTEVYILPRERNIKVGAVAVNFGANDVEFMFENKYYRMPYGTAHFLEHQMFEQQWGNVSGRFIELGAEVNAFTDGGRTVYYFKTAENFMECFRLLLNFVETPYFADESVENEKSIIKNEITMYDDDPNWRAFFGAMKMLYPDSPISQEIAGNTESIDKISPEVLYTCHRAFYTPRNMTVICAGDVCADEIITETDKIFSSADKNTAEAKCLKIQPSEGKTEILMDINIQRFCAAYPIEVSKNLVKKNFILSMIADNTFGESSEFFKEMSRKGLINEPPSVEFFEHKGLGYFAISGAASRADKVVEEIQNTIKRAKNRSINSSDFSREMKRLTGVFIRSIDDCETAAITQARFKEKSLAEAALEINKITIQDYERVLDMIGDKCGICIISKK
ncbi:putative zinc protease AlbF [Clostridiales bacterium]|nr:putative zinc protease AlbF [Clostridiales bacterium]